MAELKETGMGLILHLPLTCCVTLDLSVPLFLSL